MSNQPKAKTLSSARPKAKTLSVSQALQLAGKHYAAGRLPQAEQLLREVLKQQPKNAPALHLLGAVAYAAGKNELAIKLVKQAIASNPLVGEFHANLAEMCRAMKLLDEAVAYGEKAIALDPQSAVAPSNLGLAYFDKGDLDKAEAYQKRALALKPKFPAALNALGSVRRERKDKEGAAALYRQVLELAPKHRDALNNLGAIMTESEKPDEALRLLLQVIKTNPKYAEAHCNIANAFMLLEQFDKALAGYKQAIALNPRYPEAHRGLARLHYEQQKFPEAEAAAKKALALEPAKAEAYGLLGDIYAASGYPDKALEAFTKALELKPVLISAHLGLGHLYMERGQMKEAEASFARALELDNANLGTRMALSMVKAIKPGDENMKALVAEAAKLDGMLETKALSLHFALGKCYDDIKQYDLAFKHYLEGCRLKRKRLDYSADNNDKVIDNICEFFTPANIRRLRGPGCDSDVPVFVLGMPRSGTTLTEQIIASHPQAYGAGELPDLLRIAASADGKGSIGYPLSLKDITKADLKTMGEGYVAGLRQRNAEARRITDKMPANFNALGLIHLMLPNAKIIHVKRNPVDVCLSGFTKLFNKSQHHSYDLVEMGRYYRNYARLMEHWRKVLPKDAFYEVQYEELVADNERQARALIAYCGLPWNDVCLESHKTERSVRTASVTQVRQPVYTSSVERWRKYEAQLGPLLEALGDLVPASAR